MKQIIIRSIISLLLIVITVILGMYGKRTFQDYGLAHCKSIAEWNELDFRFMGIYGDEKAKSFQEEKNTFKEYEEAENVLVVVPTGNLDLGACTILEEVKVKQVNKGDKELEAKTIWIELEGEGFLGGKDEQVGVCGSIHNIMQENTRYLLFANESDSRNKEQGIAIYNTACLQYSYFNLDWTNQTTLLEAGKKEHKMSEYTGVEFFTTSKKLLDLLNERKKNIIEKYGNF